MPGLRRTLNAARARLDRFPRAIILLAARVAVALVFFQAGRVKLANWPVTLELFEGDYHVPLLPAAVAAVLATAIELACSSLLLVGLGARLAAALLLAMVAVVQVFVYPENWPDHLVWGTLLACVIVRGPGAISADHWIARRWLER